MNRNRPDVSDEDIGMRTFQIRKEKAVERALERLRAGLKDNWSMFTQKDLVDLDWILGELWAHENRSEWEELHFSKLSPEDVYHIIEAARELKSESRNSVETLERIATIIRARD